MEKEEGEKNDRGVAGASLLLYHAVTLFLARL